MRGGAGGKRKGTAFEHEVSQVLRMLLFYVIRSYSSMGVCDLIASPPFNPCGNNHTLLIQCKNSITKKDYVVPFEKDHLNYLTQTNAGNVILVYKDKTNVMVKNWETQEKQSFNTYIGKTFGIKCDFKELLKNYRSQKRPINLYPPPKEESGKFISPFADFYDVNPMFPHIPEKWRNKHINSQ